MGTSSCTQILNCHKLITDEEFFTLTPQSRKFSRRRPTNSRKLHLAHKQRHPRLELFKSELYKQRMARCRVV